MMWCWRCQKRLYAEDAGGVSGSSQKGKDLVVGLIDVFITSDAKLVQRF